MTFLGAESTSEGADDLIEQLIINQTVLESVRLRDIINLSNSTNFNNEIDDNQDQLQLNRPQSTITDRIQSPQSQPAITDRNHRPQSQPAITDRNHRPQSQPAITAHNHSPTHNNEIDDNQLQSQQQQACKTQVTETTTQLNNSRALDDVILSRAQND
jgi:hypothetical protein